MEKLDINQDKAANSKSTHILCNSKAGSGKTKTIMSRVSNLINSGINPKEILLITFTNKAANEMKERLTKVTVKSKDITCGTFHGIALILLRRYSETLGYSDKFSVLSPKDAESMFKEIMKEAKVLNFTKMEELESERINARKILSEYSLARNKNLVFRTYLEESNYILGHIDIILELVELFEQRKEISELMDFDDLLSNFNLLLLHEEIKKEINQRYKYILVDEFQDVNDAQFSIVDKLVPTDGMLFAVGDPYQCIYGFRGSKIEHIEGFKDFYEGEVVELNINYRSTQEILDLGAKLTNNKAKMKANKGNGKKPDIYIVSGKNQNERMANEIILEIDQLIKSGVSPSEISILARSANQLNLIEYGLRSKNINYVMRAGFSYFEKAHIKDILSFLTVISNKKNIEALRRTLSTFQGLGYKSTELIIDSYIDNGNDFSKVFNDLDSKVLRLSKKAKEGFELFREIYTLIPHASKIEDKINLILNKYYEEFLRRTQKDDYEIRISDLISLRKLSKKYSNLNEFINDVLIDSTINSKEINDSTEKVVISTIHRAKGLEWDNVFFVNFETYYNFKDEEKEDDGFEVDEDSRLSYVAVTRARKNLKVYLAKNDYYAYGTSRANLTHTFRNKNIDIKRIY